MTAFDFRAAEHDLAAVKPESLRDRADGAYQDVEINVRRELLLGAHTAIHEIIGETNGTDVVVNLRGFEGAGEVEMTIDNLRFQYQRFIDSDGDVQEELKVKRSAYSWAKVESLRALGRLLRTDPCYVVKPE